MPELKIFDINNQNVGTLEVSADIFDVKIREHLVQQYVVRQQAARRAGTASMIQNKGDLHGSGKKPWRQKGTGRARSGNTRNPIWRGGMTVFGPSPRDYGFKMSKKARKLAIKSVLTELARTDGIAVLDHLSLDSHKTKDAMAFMKTMKLPEKTLFILSEKNQNLERAVRNLPQTDVLLVGGLNVFDLLMHEKIVCTQETIKKIEERLN